ncbi:hypothetical protein HZB07_04930 [Candidatus Saganbacteria bacterium]|nr:hypothetical protein [Candidatus Saganbacteria bacterium]
MMSLIMIAGLLGFSYIVWVLANKETGTTKIVGQVLAAVIIILSLLAGYHSMVRCNKMQSSKMGCPMEKMDGMPGREMHGHGMMDKMMEKPMEKK